MSAVFFRRPQEGVATFWRIFRRDGVALGFTTHDRDLWFAGLLHRAAPGLVPSAIRRTADLSDDSAEIEGALSHAAIGAADLAAGRFDGARVTGGAVDWESLDHAVLYTGTLGPVSAGGGRFTAALRSAKAALDTDLVPRTAPTCRAAFCGPECGLSPARFEHEVVVAEVERETATLRIAGLEPTGPDAAAFLAGTIRPVDGPQAGLAFDIVRAAGNRITLSRLPGDALVPGDRVTLREGCDRLLETCHARFGNARNFRGEPFVPGNDLLLRYPKGGA